MPQPARRNSRTRPLRVRNKNIPLQTGSVASAIKILGYLLQITGMFVMFFAFFQLTSGFQNTFSMVMSAMQATGSITPDDKPLCEPGQVSKDCRLNLDSGNAIQDTFQPVIQQYIYLVILGIGLLFVGLILRSINDLSDRFGRGPKQAQKEKIRFGQGLTGI